MSIDGGIVRRLGYRMLKPTDNRVLTDKYCVMSSAKAARLDSHADGPPSPPDEASAGAGGCAGVLTAAGRARMERQRQRARALHAARRAHAPAQPPPPPAHPLDTGGGFLLEPEPVAARVPAGAPAPLVHASQQPHCDDCGKPFPQSYLFDTFDCSVCDTCRDEEGAHSLVTRTEAKTEFLLKDCDLDLREPVLRCVRRRNPHRGGGDMRLYLRAQVEARALLVWGSEAALEEERARRAERRARAASTHAGRRLRALRMDVRSSLFARERAPHAHRWDAERHCADDDTYSRACLDCGHTETYEKM